ncbi:siderophore-interacting protein [Corynebacterium sp. HS2168-gen11]|uniref:siderophore-interacting protein n=1 Tax=Corynebacterium sp. HS2168-gen11 TaxID=2974027 RepID=UPI00216AC7C4|nr:siderophore-interacting protein [Corynebacterium sp. HS2168-gen11]MCS4535100.1 siderophore-interacting protein [Corynebacterium sp. HS2168-gen11]
MKKILPVTPAKQYFAPFLAEVAEIIPVTASLTRIVFRHPDLLHAALGREVLDQRMKIIFPGESGITPTYDRHEWRAQRAALPPALKGVMRTYTVRSWQEYPDFGEVCIDFVRHDDRYGLAGPASKWLAAVNIGDRVNLVLPRKGMPVTGIEFAPGDARSIVLVGDETALPAIANILISVSAQSPGKTVHAFVEVPTRADTHYFQHPDITWLIRDEHAVLSPGQHILTALQQYIPALCRRDENLEEAVPSADRNAAIGRSVTAGSHEDANEIIWQTPTYSKSGEELAHDTSVATDDLAQYFWIAGESTMVTSVRRYLVHQCGIQRRQVAFMGYWKQGVAMRG